MPEITLVIADSDKDYLDGLESYIKSFHSAAFSNIKTFYKRDSFLEFLSVSKGDQAVYLTGPGFYELINGIKSTVIFLSPNPISGNSQKEKIIFKYHTGEVIVNFLHTIIPSSPKITRIIAVYSPLGGSGKTTVALGASILSSWEGKRIFYLNLESHSSIKAFLSEKSDQCLSHVMYYLKNSKNNLQEKLDSAKCFDFYYRIDYYLPPQSILDLTEDMSAEIRSLLDFLRSTGKYDCIFVDMETSLDRNNLSIFEEADEILVIAEKSPLLEEKLRNMYEQLRLLENGRTGLYLSKLKIILNKDRQNINNGFEEGLVLEEITLYHNIPFVQDLLVRRENGRWSLDMNSAFTNSMHLLLRSLLKG